MTIDLDSLEAAAKAATPGPWEDMSNHPDHLYGAVNKGNKHIALCNHYESAEPTKTVTGEEMLANAAFIAAVNPATVLELVAELRKARMYMAERHAFRAAWKEEWVIQNMLAGWLESIAKGETPACMAECKTAHDFVSYAAWTDAKQRGLPCSETFKNSEAENVGHY